MRVPGHATSATGSLFAATFGPHTCVELAYKLVVCHRIVLHERLRSDDGDTVPRTGGSASETAKLWTYVAVGVC